MFNKDKKYFSIDQLDINPRVIYALKKANLTRCDTILSLSGPDLERMCKVSASEANGVKNMVAEAALHTPHLCTVHTALELHNKSCQKRCNYVKLTTGCPTLDKFFKGGIISRGITELCGVSASGKTQLCLQLCLTVQLPCECGGLKAGAVYICTEDIFPNKRLYQMIDSFTRRYKHKIPSCITLGDNIYIEHIADVDSLRDCIHHRLPSLLNKGGVRLVVVDSVAALFRFEYSMGEYHERSKHLTAFAAQLVLLGDRYNIPIVCVNQVTAAMNDQSNSSVPALGLTWANQVMTRVVFTRHDQYTRSPHRQNDVRGGESNITTLGVKCKVVRAMEIVYAPHLPNWVCEFTVNQDGISGIL